MPPRRSTARAAVSESTPILPLPKTPIGLKKTPSGQFTPITSKDSNGSDEEDSKEVVRVGGMEDVQMGEESDGSSVRLLGGRARTRTSTRAGLGPAASTTKRSQALTRTTPSSKNPSQQGLLTPPSLSISGSASGAGSAAGSTRREISVEITRYSRGPRGEGVSRMVTSDEEPSEQEENTISGGRKRKAVTKPILTEPGPASKAVKRPRISEPSSAAASSSGKPSRAAKLTPVKSKHFKAELHSDSVSSSGADSEYDFHSARKAGPAGGKSGAFKVDPDEDEDDEEIDRSTSKGFSEFEGDVDDLLSEEEDDGLADTRISKHSEVKLKRVRGKGGKEVDVGRSVAKGKVGASKTAAKPKLASGKKKPIKDEDVGMLGSDDEDEKPFIAGTEGEDEEGDDLMLQAAIAASLGKPSTSKSGKKDAKASGRSSKTKSKNAIASVNQRKGKAGKADDKSEMARKMASAAERRMGKKVDTPPASDEDSAEDPDFHDGSASDENVALTDEPDTDGIGLSSDGGGFNATGTKAKGKGKTKGKLTEEETAAMIKKKAVRAEETAIKKAYQSRVLAARKVLIKKLGRRLTQGEKNGVSLGLHHPELADVWGDVEANIEIVTPVPMEADLRLRLSLMPFQKESLYWMKKQEEGPWKGGMLADEMGMGKTIQTIALLLSEPRKKPSLVVAPVVALSQWKREIETHAEGFTVCLWHGSGRMKAAELQKYDVVLVSYGTLEASFRKQQKGFKRGNVMVTEKSPMHSFKWFRIVLDEAHNIKERSTNVSKAAFALDAQYRWCLSGTPLQNRVGELYSLVRFLGGDPFAFYFCKLCDCKSLHWAFKDKRHCEQCNHSPMQHLCFWNNEILTPIQKFGMAGPGQWAFKKLKILLDRMMLRRTKLERADDLGLPPRVITIRRDYFSPQEKELYQSLFMETKRQFSSYIEEGTVLNKYSSIFSLITRMRQMSCHPDLVLRSKTAQYIKGIENEVVCRLCNDSAEDAIISKCNHVFDRECIRQYLEACAGEGAPDCPVCHVSISIDLEGASIDDGADKRVTKRQGILGRMDLENWRSSTKVEAVVEVLSDQRNRDCTIKTIIFSQFVSFLDIIAFRLQRAGFNICRIEGGMSLQARDATIQHYMKNPAVTVMLISLRAGGVALNLTEASTVIMADSWWNPSVEYQAFDRVHRFGQRRPVNVIKLVIEDSIESKIVQLQEKKLLMTEAALSKDPDAAAGKLSIEDLQFLFKL